MMLSDELKARLDGIKARFPQAQSALMPALYAVQDATIAAAYAQLAIVAAGMGSTWVGYFDENQVRAVLDLEPGLVPIALMSLGYPAQLPEPSSRRRLDEVVAWR